MKCFCGYKVRLKRKYKDKKNTDIVTVICDSCNHIYKVFYGNFKKGT